MSYKDLEKKKDTRKKWYESLSQDKKKENQDKANIRAKEIKEFLAAYKLKYGCKDCGYNEHHVALDFDHIIGDKKISVCLAKSISQAKEEIEKCEVVCANCHRIRTYIRLKQ